MPEYLWSAALFLAFGFALGYYFMSRKKDRKNARKLRRERRLMNTSRPEPDAEHPGDIAFANIPPAPAESTEDSKLVQRELEESKKDKANLESELKALESRLKRVQSERDGLARKVEVLDEQLKPLRAQVQQAEIEQRAQAKAKVSTPVDAPDFPPPQVKIIQGSTGGTWRYASGSVHGSEKTSDQCQDSSRLVITEGRQFAILAVADGAGSLKHSNIGAQEAVLAASKSARAELEIIEAKGETLTRSAFLTLAGKIFGDALAAVNLRAESEKQKAQLYGSTLIVLIAGPDFTACAHVGDGRAGCCLRDGQWIPLLTPMKGGEANMTRFLTHLRDEPDLVQANYISLASSAVFCISDGCESASWHTKTKPQYRTNGALVDPNIPSSEFWAAIAKTVAELPDKFRAEGKPESEIQGETDRLFSQFLLGGNLTLKAERDDKTIALAVNLP